MSIKASTVAIIVLVGVGIYLYATSIASKVAFIIENVDINVEGLVTQLQITFLVTSSAPAALSLSNFAITAIYNGSVIGTGTVTGTINPGQNNISGTVNLSDLTIVSDIANAINNNISSVTITVPGIWEGRIRFPSRSMHHTTYRCNEYAGRDYS